MTHPRSGWPARELRPEVEGAISRTLTVREQTTTARTADGKLAHLRREQVEWQADPIELLRQNRELVALNDVLREKIREQAEQIAHLTTNVSLEIKKRRELARVHGRQLDAAEAALRQHGVSLSDVLDALDAEATDSTAC